MFANLESFSLFFFVSLAFIVLAIAFEDKLTALEKKHNRKKAQKRHNARVVGSADIKSKSYHNPSVRSRVAVERKSNRSAA